MPVSVTRHNIDRAIDLFNKARTLDPSFASAYGMEMFCHANRLGFGLTGDFEAGKEKVSALWQVVTRIGNEDGVALAQAGWAVAYVLRDVSSARTLIDRATELNPNLANGWVSSGWLNIWLGQPERAMVDLSHGQRLDPSFSSSTVISAMAHASFFLDRYADALAHAEHFLRRSPDAHPALRIGAASAAFGDRVDVAQQMAARLLAVDPGFSIARLTLHLGPYQRSEFVEKYAEGLRRAGIPAESSVPARSD